MSGLRARVEKGRLVLDEPTTLPEGTVVDPVADDEGDDLIYAFRTTLDLQDLVDRPLNMSSLVPDGAPANLDTDVRPRAATALFTML